MPENYTRTQSSSQNRHAPQHHTTRRKKRRRSMPPIIPIGLAVLVLLIALIIFAVSSCVSGGKKDPEGTSTPSSSPSSGTTSTGTDDSSADASPTADASPSATATATPPPEKDIANLKTDTLGSVMIVGDAGYEYYNFVESTANDYIDTINSAAEKLKGSAKLIEMIVPTSMAVILPDNIGDYMNDISVSDQQKALTYFYSSFNSNVTPVNVFDTLSQHRDEYIFFRTDHHWTALGAYYAYCDAATKAGLTPLPLTDFEKKSYDNFLGSFYSDSDNNPALSKNPDTVDVYVPSVSTTMNVTQNNGEILQNWPLIMDVSDYASNMKYNTFIGGDNPYTEILNNDATNNDACIVVKESFGNAMIPFLVPHYKNVYVIDYRYYTDTVENLVKKTGAKDVYVINNISMTRSTDRVNDLGKVF